MMATSVMEISQSQAVPELSSPAQKSSWIEVVTHLDPKYGGLSSAVPALSSAVADRGNQNIQIAGFCAPGESYAPFPGDENLPVSYFPASRSAWFRERTHRRRFEGMISDVAGVHIHGLWQQSTSFAAATARRLRKPYVVSAHGMLERWALRNKKWKKRIYAALSERAALRRAACLHALTEAEVQDYRNFGLDNPVAVIPNGVTIPASISSTPFLASFPTLRGKRLILFLGRIHFKKGLDILAEAWSRVRGSWPEAELVLAGPDFEGTRAAVEEKLNRLGVTRSVTFTGMLRGEMKWSALKACHCFVLPSYSEGLSVSVLEAMGVGRPVIVTEQCNLPEVRTSNCGWVIQPQADELESALDAVLETTEDELKDLGQRGQLLVGQQYSWPVVGAKMAALYSWLEGGPLPSDFPLSVRGGV